MTFHDLGLIPGLSSFCTNPALPTLAGTTHFQLLFIQPAFHPQVFQCRTFWDCLQVWCSIDSFIWSKPDHVQSNAWIHHIYSSSAQVPEIVCIDPHQTGFVGEGSDHFQLIKFLLSRAPGNGVCSGVRSFSSTLLQPARSVCVSSERFFIINFC